MTAADLVRQMRQSLAAAGMVRRELDGSVYWSGGQVLAPSGAEGPSPVLVLLHGTNDQAGTWWRVVPMLIRNYRLIIPDLAGHGESDPRTGPIPFKLVVDKLHTILKSQQNITLVGNSFGGWIALLYALEHPEYVNRLVLEAGGGLALPLGVPVVAQDRSTAITILRAVWGPDYVPQEWVIDALLMRATDSPMLRLEGAEQNYLEGRLSQISVPTSLVWGEHDGVVPLSYARTLQKSIAGSRLHVIENAAHIPHLQQPEKFVACLTATS